MHNTTHTAQHTDTDTHTHPHTRHETHTAGFVNHVIKALKDVQTYVELGSEVRDIHCCVVKQVE
jgi:hypothetical protein